MHFVLLLSFFFFFRSFETKNEKKLFFTSSLFCTS